MIQVIHRAFDVLELLASQPERVFSLGEIAEAAELNRGTCSNILKTLAARSYVTRLSGRGGYRLGSMASPWEGQAAQDRESGRTGQTRAAIPNSGSQRDQSDRGDSRQEAGDAGIGRLRP
jgi:DNA-binding IclR family transcriptional regulator